MIVLAGLTRTNTPVTALILGPEEMAGLLQRQALRCRVPAGQPGGPLEVDLFYRETEAEAMAELERAGIVDPEQRLPEFLVDP
jgi:hypothetical protein